LKTLATFFLLALASCQNPTNAIDNSIKKFKTEYADQFVTYQAVDRKMQYAWSGDQNKRPLLFVHGSPGSLEGWSEFMMNADLQKKFHLISVDRPGYGGSGEGLTETSVEKQAADIVKVLDSNKSGLKAILVGHSFGGPVIARLAMDYPDRIAGLVFVSSSVDPSLEETKWYQYPADWVIVRWMLPNFLRVCNQEIMPLKGELEKMLPLWGRIRAVTAIVHGDEDDMVPYANVSFISKNIKSDLLINIDTLKGMNHFVPWRNPESIVNAIELVNARLLL
jgi:pimeloyl-ACP methyl ester carboxylesterase